MTLLPISAIAVRASAGATSPGAIILPSLVATVCSTAVAILAAKLLARREPDREETLLRSPPSIPAISSADLVGDIAAEETPPAVVLEEPGLMGKLLFGGRC